jgi:RNA polymerase sigma factor (sigma-70 family)
LARCREKDKAAWKLLVERYAALILSVPRRYGLPQERAEDVLGEVSVALVKALGSIGDGQVPRWLIRTVTLRTSEAARKDRVTMTPDDMPPLTGAAPTDEMVAALEEEQRIREALARIGERCRKLLVPLYFGTGAAEAPRGKPGSCLDKLRQELGGLPVPGDDAAGHPDFAALLGHLAGRTDEQVVSHVAHCSSCAAAAQKAARLLEAGRRAVAEPKPSRRALSLARQAFVTGRTPSLLELVFDSFRSPATAEGIRSGALTSRYLRFAGDVHVEIEIREGARGTEVRGQLTPPSYAAEAALFAGKVRRRAKVSADGSFLLRNVPRKTVEIRVGNARIQTEL